MNERKIIEQINAQEQEGFSLGPEALPNINNMQSQAAMKRVENWATDFLANDELQSALDQGSMPLKHLAHFNFRGRNVASANISDKLFLPCKQYCLSPLAKNSFDFFSSEFCNEILKGTAMSQRKLEHRTKSKETKMPFWTGMSILMISLPSEVERLNGSFTSRSRRVLIIRTLKQRNLGRADGGSRLSRKGWTKRTRM